MAIVAWICCDSHTPCFESLTIFLFSDFRVSIYNYKEKKSLFRGHKGQKILYMETTDLDYYDDKHNIHGFILTFNPDAFEENFPSILENLLKKMDLQLAKKREKEEILRKNAAWDGVIK